MLEKHTIPIYDLFSQTRSGYSRPPYEWLSQIIFSLINRIMGLDGIVLFTAYIIALTFTLIYKFSVQRSRSPVFTLAIIFIAAGASSIHWLPRPHIFTFILLAIWIDLLDRLVQDKTVRQ